MLFQNSFEGGLSRVVSSDVSCGPSSSKHMEKYLVLAGSVGVCSTWACPEAATTESAAGEKTYICQDNGWYIVSSQNQSIITL